MIVARSFAQWLSRNAPLLHQGHELLLPFTLPHPKAVGFRETSLASFGQQRDWTLGLHRGRLVVHELAHGQCIIRLDRSASRRSCRAIGGRPLALFVEAAEAGVGVLAAALVSVGGMGLATLDVR